MVKVFEEVTADLTYRPKALFPSELFLFHSHANLNRCDMIIESGTGWGGSAQYLARLFPLVPVYSIDQSEGMTDQVKAMGLKVKFITARAQLAIPMILDKKQPERAAVLIDGPKGKAAAKLACELLNDWQNVCFVAVHDLTSDLPGQYVIHSHTQHFRALAGHLDDKVGQVARLKHPKGPGLTIFDNPYR